MKKLLLFIITCFTMVQLQAQGWGEIQKIVPEDRFVSHYFGADVAIDGSYAVVGVLVNNFAKDAYVFQNDGNGNWVQIQKLESPDPHQFAQFGTAVDISGNYIFVGSWGNDYDASESNFLDSAGAVYIFKKQSSGNFDFVQKIVASDREALNCFGYKLAVNGNYAVVSPVRHDYDVAGNNFLDDAGAAYIFELDSGGTWNEVQKIVASDRGVQDFFGQTALAVSDDYIVVGAFPEDEDENGANTILSTGSVYIFKRDDAGTWNQIQKIVASDREEGEWFGKSVGISGNTIVVGAENEYLTGNTSAQYGAVYIFEEDDRDVWNEVEKIRASYLDSFSKFGQTVSIDGNHFIVGAYRAEIGSVSDGGAAFMFEKDGSGMWNEVAVMYDLNAKNADNFGFDVAISGDYAMVGAHQEDEDENGENTLLSTGSVYVFDVNTPNTLKPLNTLSTVGQEFVHNISAYPNPVKDMLHLDLKHTVDLNIKISNMLGQIVFSNDYKNSHSINVPCNMPKGLYLVELIVDKKSVSVFKILKQ